VAHHQRRARRTVRVEIADDEHGRARAMTVEQQACGLLDAVERTDRSSWSMRSASSSGPPTERAAVDAAQHGCNVDGIASCTIDCTLRRMIRRVDQAVVMFSLASAVTSMGCARNASAHSSRA
jgi:hypothetical protein